METSDSHKKSDRKYNSNYRKKIVGKIGKISNKSDLIDIFYIINEDIGPLFSSNSNGIFINANILSDNCIDKLIEFLDDKLGTLNTETEQKINYKIYKSDEIESISEMGHKLSNQEKSIIKRIRNKD